jgi:hypothetical protein
MRMRTTCVVAFLFAAACGSSGIVTERTGTATDGTCACCGHVVDIASGESCSDATCAPYCDDASADGASE